MDQLDKLVIKRIIAIQSLHLIIFGITNKPKVDLRDTKSIGINEVVKPKTNKPSLDIKHRKAQIT